MPIGYLDVPAGAELGTKRQLVKALADAYGLPDFAVFFLEHSLDTVAINGSLLADDQRRVADQTEAYS